MDPQSVYAVATMDTKGHELAFVAERLRALGVAVVTIDVGTKGPPEVPADVDRSTVAGFHPTDSGRTAALSHSDRGQAITAMSEALVSFCAREYDQGKVAGVIGIGGSGGTRIDHARNARSCRWECPSSWSRPSPAATRPPLSAAATSRSCLRWSTSPGSTPSRGECSATPPAPWPGWCKTKLAIVDEKPTIAMTMFGVTTPCVAAVRRDLEARGFDCLVFHATGTGGQAMEKLVEAGLDSGRSRHHDDRSRRPTSSAASCRAVRTASRRSSRPRFPLSFRSVLSTWSTSGPSRLCRKGFGTGGFMFTTRT